MTKTTDDGCFDCGSTNLVGRSRRCEACKRAVKKQVNALRVRRTIDGRSVVINSTAGQLRRAKSGPRPIKKAS